VHLMRPAEIVRLKLVAWMSALQKKEGRIYPIGIRSGDLSAARACSLDDGLTPSNALMFHSIGLRSGQRKFKVSLSRHELVPVVVVIGRKWKRAVLRVVHGGGD
jgi:hypothetical protein